jgi:ABC-2 type transport system ATP-binding protein
MAESAIRIENLTKDFGSVRALDGISLEVPAGVIFGFLGPNGAGKTTTIHLLLGLLEPTAGSVQVFGFDTRTQAAEVRANSGALLEHTGIYEHRTTWNSTGGHSRSPPQIYRRASRSCSRIWDCGNVVKTRLGNGAEG